MARAAGNATDVTAARLVREESAGLSVPLWVQPEWAERFPWLAQGTTGRGDEGDPFDLGLFGRAPVGAVLGRWRRLCEALGFERAVHARQVHGAEPLEHAAGPPGLCIADGFDAHVTATAGVLLTISVADCVPVSLVDAERRTVALLHAGWRGTAAGVLERGIAALAQAAGSRPDTLCAHLGPAICGECYEVGPEVHEALGLSRPASNSPVDLRAQLALRAARAGIPPARITVSAHCTRCGEGRFFSHRGGRPERQMGVLGIQAAAAP